ncbi:MAG: ArsA family ATPase [Actinomycetia bacterium]|nr:ArsA family ATPase [Actinomycetes bacterium]
MNPSLAEIVTNREVVVCTGTGGVGKTTAAATIAIEGARQGQKAVVVTIDPARRLADALGIERQIGPDGRATAGLGNEASIIDGPWTGELWATMLDTRSTFDGLVARHAESPAQADQILANPFYRNISAALSGTQEYMAMERLHTLHDTGDYDLIVVDTPPSRNALDFLEAPNQLARFLDHPVYRMLTAPGRGVMRVVNVAAQTMLRTTGKLVGSGVLDDTIDFFRAFEGLEEGFRGRSLEVLALLESPRTAFVLVASPRADTVAEAGWFAEKLGQAAIEVDALVVNRMLPRFGSARAVAAALAHGTESSAERRANLAQLEAVALSEDSHLERLAESMAPAPVVRVPELSSDVHDIEGLIEVGGYLFGRR